MKGWPPSKPVFLLVPLLSHMVATGPIFGDGYGLVTNLLVWWYSVLAPSEAYFPILKVLGSERVISIGGALLLLKLRNKYGMVMW